MRDAIEPVSYRLAKTDPDAFVRHFAGSFERYGFAVVSDHELPQGQIDGCLDRFKRFFAQVGVGEQLFDNCIDRAHWESRVIVVTDTRMTCVHSGLGNRETYEVVNIGRALAGEPPLRPKDGAKFHFELPGAVQGFTAQEVDRMAKQNPARLLGLP